MFDDIIIWDKSLIVVAQKGRQKSRFLIHFQNTDPECCLRMN